MSNPTEPCHYKYAPLPTPTSIRLLRIDSKKYAENSDTPSNITCSLKTVDLATDPYPWYHALSYTWGNPLPVNNEYFRPRYADEQVFTRYDSENGGGGGKCVIHLDGERFHVSRNLFDALCSIPSDAWARNCNRGNTKKKKAHAPLHWAGISGNEDFLCSVLAGGGGCVDVDLVDGMGRTGLSYAAEFGRGRIVELLLMAGADGGVVDCDGKRAVDYARENGHGEIVVVLEGEEEGKGRLPVLQLPEGPQVWVWIDQICINQEDLDERATQVMMMDQIYKKARYTMVWLGAEDQYTELAIKTIWKIDSAPADFQYCQVTPYLNEGRDLYEKENIPYISPEEWTALAALFLRDYFRRLWVVQENVLSGTILGYCGKHEVPWRVFCFVAQLVYFRQQRLGRITSTQYINKLDAVVGIESQAVSLVQWRERFEKRDKAAVPKEFSLESLIFDTWTFRATDPRDKIFGVYGLLNRTGKEIWRPDYHKPVEEVYAEATKKIMQQSGELRMLSAALDRSIRNIPTLPSWVPDYSLTYTNMMCAVYDAAKNLPICPIRPTAWNVLGVSGAKIDTVLDIGNTTQGPGDQNMIFDPRWLELLLLIPVKYHTGQTRTEVLWRTICGNQHLNGSIPAPDNYGDAFRKALCIMVSVIAKNETKRAVDNPKLPPSLKAALAQVKKIWSTPPMSTLAAEDIEFDFSEPDRNLSSPQHQNLIYYLFKLQCFAATEPCPFTPTLEQIEERYHGADWEAYDKHSTIVLPEESADYYMSVRSRYGKRRVFVTSKRYLGLGPRSTQVGDEIWVLPGAGAAFVLRKAREGSSYWLIGEAYVHGAMDGELVDGLSGELCDIELV
ncbi:hypothetical protein AJ79_07034 [Helicocarpus griseus UAMH5409]|uniref:Heterokaryon incompatibility domain-containing protein n=1 Tax=Helicocarpus griseus UAMH5409 TaxID=1447875 RepID=A0A2B7X7D6_9EURO|nr:hypothetical protein AJ79_07034 [Helicocarpus griseus UAMH5409]